MDEDARDVGVDEKGRKGRMKDGDGDAERCQLAYVDAIDHVAKMHIRLDARRQVKRGIRGGIAAN